MPFVASPRVEYQHLTYEALRSAGKTVLADTPKDWYRKVKALVESPSLREDLSWLGREYVRAECTIEGQAWRWAEAWSDAVRIQQGLNVNASHV